MAAPWRCSQCGTINEPVANSCRTCGRWPSLFELEDSSVEDVQAEELHARDAREAVLEVGELAPVELGEAPADAEAEAPEPERRRRSLLSYLVPLAFVVYLVLSFFLGER